MNHRRSVLSPALLVPVVLALLALGYFGYRWFAAGQAVAAERAKLIEHVAIELAKPVPDAGELSLLGLRIEKFADHATAPDLLSAMARIELARGRPEKAYELFVPVAQKPGASPPTMALAAKILLRYHQTGAPSRGQAVILLEEALALADQAHAQTRDVEDLLHAWLAAVRLSDKKRIDEFASRIEAEYPESAARRMVAITRTFSASMDRNELELVRAEFDEPPVELDAMLALLTLGGGDVDTAVSLAERMLASAPGVVEVRWAAAVVFHACAEGSPAGTAARSQWAVRRNAQLDWLTVQGAPDDSRRATWSAMRNAQ